jgi:hypothetical protein
MPLTTTGSEGAAVTTPRAEDAGQAEDTTGAGADTNQNQDPDADPGMMDTATRRNEADAEGAG